MKDLLVGSTGFVGGNLNMKHEFQWKCHSANVKNYYGSSPGLCVYAGVPSAMFLANSFPDRDMSVIHSAMENIRAINPERLVLISTIAVYADPNGVYESTMTAMDGLSTYGKNRLQLEKWVREDYPDALIIRLPALYGIGLKKNFLFDMHSVIPVMLTPAKYNEIKGKYKKIGERYPVFHNGFYMLDKDRNLGDLKVFFSSNDFNALSFTDSRSKFQFYNLNRLWKDIVKGIENRLKVLNIATPPVSAGEIYEYITEKKDWCNKLDVNPFDYDMKSQYSELFGGSDGYFITKEEELKDIKMFMEGWK